MSNYSFNHTGITVSDIEHSIAFYKDNFGFEELIKKDKPQLELKLASLKLNSSYLELIQPYKTEIKPKIKKNQSLKDLLKNSTSHIAFSIDDLHLAYKALEQNNISLTEFNEKFFFCQDPDGFLIEVRKK